MIDADALIEQMDAEPEGGYYSPHDVISLLMTQPVVEERKKGKWNCSDDYYETGVCSACEWDVGEAYADCKKWFKFCPNCGADMRGETWEH